MTKKRWKQQTNMPKDSGRVVVYCKEDEKEEWAKEADQDGYRSRSSYLYKLIQEARAYRQEGFLARENSQERIQQLEDQVEHLKQKLENPETRSPTPQTVDEEALKQALTDQYQPLEKVLKQAIDQGLLEDLARKPVEDCLYELASKGEIEYQRGFGWKNTGKGGGSELPGDWMNNLPQNKHDTVNEFIRRKKSMGRSQSTLYEYSRILKKFYHEHFPDLEPEETEVRHVEDYLYILGERDVSDNGKRRYVESLSAFFSYAMKRPRFEGITGNPAAVVLEELPRQIKDRPDCATWENGAEIIHRVGDPRNKTVAVILAKTGARLSEVLEITMDDLMLQEGFIRLRKRKGGKQTVVPIDQETIKAIQRFKFLRNSRGLDYLFVSTRGQRLSKEQIRRSIRNAAVDADIMKQGESRFHKKFTPHTYRTVFTTLMRNQGMEDHILQYIRGDSNNQTMDIYTRVDRNQARTEYRDCIKKLNL